MDPFPDHSAASVFWLPEDDTSVVILASPPPCITQDTVGSRLPTAVATEVDQEGVHAVLDLCNGERLQVLATIAAPATAVIPLGLDGFGRLEALHRLLAAIHRRAIPPDTRVTAQQRARAKRMLRAVDGYRDGAPQQDIAHILFQTDGLDRAGWQDASARHAIKSLLREARALISGGYLRLLRHRRRR